MANAKGKSGSRRKTGCFACRGRHLRCDEALPVCRNCAKAGLQCERSGMIMFVPYKQKASHEHRRRSRPTSEASNTSGHKSSWDDASETAFLLRRFQDGIAIWMDIFDQKMSFQLSLMRKAVQSELLRSCICALASRQMALLNRTSEWEYSADRYYGKSLQLLQNRLADDESIEDTLPASVLLLSFELMAGIGRDYSRHFRGARSLIEHHFDQIAATHDEVLRASYWIFVRHDVDFALSIEQPVLLEQRFWLHCTSEGEDELGNRALVIAAKAVRTAFGSETISEKAIMENQVQDELEDWYEKACQCVPPLQVGSDANIQSLFYPTSSSAAAMQMYQLTKLLLNLEGNEENAQQCAKEVISISRTHVSDAVQVQAVRLLYQAAKRARDPEMVGIVIDILANVQQKTGFTTEEEISKLKSLATEEFSET